MKSCNCGYTEELIDRFTISNRKSQNNKPAKACSQCSSPRCMTCGINIPVTNVFCSCSCRCTFVLNRKWKEDNYRRNVVERMTGNQHTVGKTWTLSEEAKLNHSVATKSAITRGQPIFRSYEEFGVKEILESRGFVHQYQFYSDYGTVDNYHKRYHFNLDFADPVRRINIEIDGLTHSIESTKEYDEFRDEILVHYGWVVHRIYTKDICGIDEKYQIDLIGS